MYSPHRTNWHAGIDPISVFVLIFLIIFPFLPSLNLLHKKVKCVWAKNNIWKAISFSHIPYSPPFCGNFLQLICPRQRRKSGQEGVDLEGLQAGLEKLAMKPKVIISYIIPLLSSHTHGFRAELRLSQLMEVNIWQPLSQGSPLKLNENEMKEVKEMADSQSSAMRRLSFFLQQSVSRINWLKILITLVLL